MLNFLLGVFFLFSNMDFIFIHVKKGRFTMIRMNMHLYELRTKEDEPVIRFDMAIRSGMIYVYNATIITQNKLNVPYYLRDKKNMDLNVVLSEWLKIVAIEMCPYKTGPDLDSWISRQLYFSSDMNGLGRLDRFIASVGLKNHFKSDDYYVSSMELYFWGELSYPGWTTLFIDAPINWEELKCI